MISTPKFGSARHDGIELGGLEPKQDTVAIGLVGRVANRAVMVGGGETMQLKNELPIEHKPFVLGSRRDRSGSPGGADTSGCLPERP